MRRRRRKRRSAARRILLYGIGGLVAVLVLAQVALLLLFDANAYKHHLEQAASAALGMEVRLHGRISIELLPALHFALRGVEVRNRGSTLATVPHTSIGIDVLPLLRGDLRLGTIRLTRPRVYVERDAAGNYNFERPVRGKPGRIPGFDVGQVQLADLAMTYVDKKADATVELEGCRLRTRRLSSPGGRAAQIVKNIVLEARLGCREIRRGPYRISDLALALTAADGIYELAPISMRVLGGTGTGAVRIDASRPVKTIDVRYALAQFRVEELFRASTRQSAEGALDLDATLSLRGRKDTDFVRSAAGRILLRGSDLVLNGTDIDKALARYESSQSFNLLDAGAFFFAGPIGLVATKGYSFAAIARDASGTTPIPMLVSDWRIERGVAHAQDVALATAANRLAVRGRLDFVNERFDDVAIAAIDEKGCPKLRQTIRGPFRDPTFDKPSVLAALAGPAVRLLKAVTFAGCEVFYNGSVAPPVKG
ncbi:MAG TPA: AsmA family protein [Burkholderiales bacterium]